MHGAGWPHVLSGALEEGSVELRADDHGGQEVWVLRMRSAWKLRRARPGAWPAGSWPYGLRVVGIDRFLVPWPCLAHGGKSRLFRMA
jgi:hypothetical protein